MRNKKLVVLLAIFAVITTLIVFSSVVFSVQSVYAHCYNADDEFLDSVVCERETSTIRRGQSIFLLNEDEIIESIEKKCSEVKVINVERKFPNRVYINYVKIFPSLVFETETQALALSPDCEILDKSDKQEYYPSLIKVISANKQLSEEEGAVAFSLESIDYLASKGICDAMIKMNLYNESVNMFEFIDLSRDEVIFIKTRTGVFFELQGGVQNIAEKVRIAVSVYLSDETSYMNGGTIIVSTSGKSASYSTADRYNKA